ncbi:MAG: hypothetical protein HRU19_29565 [Pseudobacteriovorax sp.]|nr:hypothetical protein [Pseudobacteriovorax sp.]
MSQTLTIEIVKSRFDDWRSKKVGGRSRIPDHIRMQAVELAKTVPRPKVIEQLRINGSILKEWERS